MPVAFFIVPYERVVAPSGRGGRRCAMDRYTAAILADGGEWREAECLGNRCVVKVRAAAGTLTNIATAEGWFRFPLAALDNPLSSLTNAQRTAVRNQLTAAGYPAAEVTAAFPNLSAATVGDVIRFLLTRRLKPRYDPATDSVIVDGPARACEDVAVIDAVQ